MGIGEQGSPKGRATDSAAAGKERRPAVLRNFDISYIGVCAPQIWIYCIAHRSDGALGEVALGVPLYLALSATMAVVMMLVLRGCVPSLRRLAWPLAVVQGLASVALVVPLLPASPSASIFYAVAAALAGACIGFLWFNSHPADIFMGDTGSLALGMALGCLAVVTKTEFVVIIIGGLFVAEALSVMIQVFYYKKTKKRIFLMAPLHHHFEKKGWSETKVVVRFWIVSGMLAACGFVLYFATTLGA
mgnify:FL=1